MPFEVTKEAEQSSGGFEVTKAASGAPTAAQSVAEEPEGWDDWAMRNAVKAFPDILAGAKSGFGIGNLEHLLRTQLGGDPEEWPNYVTGLPTFQEARRGNRAIFPKGMKEYGTETRAGDWFPELLTQNAVPALLTGGLKSFPAAAESLLSALGVYGGSQLGENIAQGAFPESKLAQAAGSIAGGFGGGLTSRFIPGTGKSIMPSRSLAPEKVLTEAKPEQSGLYNAAEKLAEGVAAKPNKLLEATDAIKKRFGYGMAEKDVKDISKLVEDIEARTQSGVNSPAGTLSLEEAKAFRREINHRFKDINSPTMKHDMGLINNELKNFILKEGSSEHNALWLKGEKLTQNIGDLQTKLKKAATAPEWIKYAKGIGKYGITPTISGLSHFLGFSPTLAGGITGLSLTAGKIFNEAWYLREISKKFPTSYNKYLDTMYHAIKSDSPKVLLRLNDIADEMNKKIPFEEKSITQ